MYEDNGDGAWDESIETLLHTYTQTGSEPDANAQFSLITSEMEMREKMSTHMSYLGMVWGSSVRMKIECHSSLIDSTYPVEYTYDSAPPPHWASDSAQPKR